MYKYGKIEEAIWNGWNEFKCTFYYRDLRTHKNPHRCTELLYELYAVFDDWNIYDLLKEVPKKPKSEL
jgi:hypothetical protein